VKEKVSYKILQMIADVDPLDGDTLDEIDAQVYKYIYPKHGKPPKRFKIISLHDFTRSRDALFNIRLEQFELVKIISNPPDGYYVSFRHKRNLFMANGLGKTECLAELHAIIKEYDYVGQ